MQSTRCCSGEVLRSLWPQYFHLYSRSGPLLHRLGLNGKGMGLSWPGKGEKKKGRGAYVLWQLLQSDGMRLRSLPPCSVYSLNDKLQIIRWGEGTVMHRRAVLSCRCFPASDKVGRNRIDGRQKRGVKNTKRWTVGRKHMQPCTHPVWNIQHRRNKKNIQQTGTSTHSEKKIKNKKLEHCTLSLDIFLFAFLSYSYSPPALPFDYSTLD